jgi:hypothetical protein
MAANAADAEDQKPLSAQRMKRTSYGGPSQIVLEMECSLRGASRRCGIASCRERRGT